MWTPDTEATKFSPQIPTSSIAAEEITQMNNINTFTALEEITSDKYLGVIIDNKLSFNDHVNHITNKATKLLNLCRRNLYMCPRDTKEAAYKAIVRPHLEYASSAWSPHTTNNIEKIEKVQRRGARFVLGNYNYGPTNSINRDIENILKWPSLHLRRTAHDIHLLHKIINNNVNIELPPVIRNSPTHPTRFLHVQALHSEAFKNSFFVRTIKIWNKIPPSIHNIKATPTFKLQSNNFIFSRKLVKINQTWTI